MSEHQISTDLQRKVKNIAIGSIVLHVIGFLGEILQSLEAFASRYSEIFHSTTFLSMLIETAIGLMASSLLYYGARKRNKYLLIPFMIIMVGLQFFLVITLFFFGMLCLQGDPIIYFAMAMLVVLITFVCWMLRTTKALYDEIRKNENLVSVSETLFPNPTHDHGYNQVSQPFQSFNHSNPVGLPESNGSIRINGAVDLEANGTNLQVNLPVPSLNNLNEDARTEPPPPYNETANPTTNNDGQELPPSYDQAMEMKKERVYINEAHA